MNARACAVAVLTIATSIPLNAAVLTVINLADSGPGSLRDRVGVSASGDTIQFAITGTIFLNSAIQVTHPLYIVGPGASELFVDGQQMDRAFVVDGEPVAISGMTISNCLAAGANGPNAPSFELNGGPGGNVSGGAILNTTGTTLYLSNCWFTGNTAQGGNGGNGADNPASTAFTTGNGGSAGYAVGGAISAAGSLIIVNCTFSGNRATGGNGGGGGTNYNLDPTSGGAGGDAGSGNAGAVDEEGMTNLALNSTFSGNVATGGNGGRGGDSQVGAGGNGGNGDDGVAGGIKCYVPTAFSSDTIISNSALAGNGGAGGNGFPPGTSGTAGFGGAGGVAGYLIYIETFFSNTIVAENFASTSDSNFSVSMIDAGYNFLGTSNTQIAGHAAATTQIGMVAPIHPGLGPLAQNGGGIPTHAVLLTSLVLDQGYSFGLTTDERGAPRPYDFPAVPNQTGGDGSDIGAFELGSPDLGASEQSNVLVLSWPAAYGDFVLQSATNLQGPGNWNDVASAPQIVSNQFVFTDLMTNGSTFYRLLNRPVSP